MFETNCDIPKNTYFCENYKVMKILRVLLLIPILMGCQKYELQTPPVLTGGKWFFYDFEIVQVSSISPLSIVKNDTICINSFNNQSFVSGNVLMRQNFNNTTKDRRFVIGKTAWEFDGTVGSSFLYLLTDFVNFNSTLQPSHEPFEVIINRYSDKISVYNTETGGRTLYTYDVNKIESNGVSPLTKMTLLSEPIVTDLYLSNGTRDKAVTVRILLKFMR